MRFFLLLFFALSPVFAANIRILDGGELVVRSELAVPAGDIIVEDGGTLQVDSGSLTTAVTLDVKLGGVVTGCGNIVANVINFGTMLGNCGAGTQFFLNGAVTNEGEIYITNETKLVADQALFTNNGVLDVITGSFTPAPGLFVDNGTFLELSDVAITAVNFSGDDVLLSAETWPRHFYQLKTSPDLETWSDVGPIVDGVVPSPLIHTNGVTVAPDGRAFYRLEVTD